MQPVTWERIGAAYNSGQPNGTPGRYAAAAPQIVHPPPPQPNEPSTEARPWPTFPAERGPSHISTNRIIIISLTLGLRLLYSHAPPPPQNATSDSYPKFRYVSVARFFGWQSM